ncbi:MAG: flavodoxin family protein [Chloroflexota bacterium]
MKVLVAYTSRTGNTKKIAETIFQEVRAEKEIKPLSEVTCLDGYDLAFIGLPIEMFGPAKEAKAFLEAHSAGNRIALFMTHAAPEDSELVPACLDQCKEAAAKSNLVGLFDCQGELGQSTKMAMLNSGVPELRAWAEMDNSQGQPDATRLERARAFAREIMARVG